MSAKRRLVKYLLEHGERLDSYGSPQYEGNIGIRKQTDNGSVFAGYNGPYRSFDGRFIMPAFLKISHGSHVNGFVIKDVGGKVEFFDIDLIPNLKVVEHRKSEPDFYRSYTDKLQFVLNELGECA